MPEDEVKLDEGAASVFIGVDPEYQNYSHHTMMPIVTPTEVQQFIEDGTLELVVVDGEDVVTGNVGVLAGQGADENSATAPVAESDKPDDEVDGDAKTEESGEKKESSDTLEF